MSRITEIIDRIEDQVADLSGRVSGVERISEIADQVRALQGFVVQAREQAAVNSLGAQSHRQLVKFPFSVVIAFPGKGAHAEKSLMQIDPLQEAIKAALTGWKHPAALAGTDYVGGGPIDINVGSHVIVGLDFAFTYYLIGD